MQDGLETIKQLREAVTGCGIGRDIKKRKLILEFLGVKFGENDDFILVEVNGSSLKKLKIDKNGLISRNEESLVKVHAGERNGKQETNIKYVLMLYDKDKSTPCFYFADIETFNNNIKPSKKNIAYNDDKIEELKEKLKEILVGIGMSNEPKSKNIKKEIEDMIANGAPQIILTGAPGTGKTRLAKEIAEDIGTELSWKDNEIIKYELVQFHPSYDYTDFIEGIRPVEKGEKIEFQKLDGTFKKFCRYVAENNTKEENKGRKYFFIIDEINRADLSKVFGELMYCLESDKRGEKNKIQTQYQNIPTYFTETDCEKIKKIREENKNAGDVSEGKSDVFEDGFYIPENVIIIGTMNDIDRSVESMDFALRRRFLWKEIIVEKEVLKDSLKDILNTCSDEIIEEIAKRIDDLNINVIAKQPGLDRHYYISQGQFSSLPETILDKLPKQYSDGSSSSINEFMEAVFELRLESLLYEYVRGEGSEDTFIGDCKKALGIDNEKNDTNSVNHD